MTLIGTCRDPAQITWPAPLQSGRLADYCGEAETVIRATSSCSPAREYRDSIPEGAGPAGQPSHIFSVDVLARATPWDGRESGDEPARETADRVLAGARG
jgi:hypothetical protein